MIKLLCINNKPIPGKHNLPDKLLLIKEGNIYKGEETTAYDLDGTWHSAYYIPSLIAKYAAQRFIPISDIDEMALINNKEELVNA